jgi:TRAP-type uncharacterized transport system fused permease subunit
MRALHLMFLLPFAFLLFPASRRSPRHRPTGLDWLWVLVTVVTTGYVLANAQELTERWESVHPVTAVQVAMGTLLILAVLEAARRAVSPRSRRQWPATCSGPWTGPDACS